METVAVEELIEQPLAPAAVVEVDADDTEQTHIVPEIEVKKKFFDFNGGNDYLTLKLAANGVRVESVDKKISKNLSYQGLVKTLSNQASLDTGLLPLLGDSYIAVRRYMVFKNKHFVFIEASPKKRTIVYDTTGDEKNYKKFDIPFPGILLAVVLSEDANGKLFFQKDHSKLFALSSPIFNDKTKVYRYPYTNVYPDNRICWGSTLDYMSKSRYEMTVQQTAGLIDIFLTGVNNNDLWDPAANHLKSGDITKTFKDLETKTSYPLDTLKESMTFHGVVSLLTQNEL